MSEDGATGGLRPRRRELFTAAGVAAVAGVAGLGGGFLWGRSDRDQPDVVGSPTASPASGVPGITAPAVPQRHIAVTVLVAGANASAPEVLDRVRGLSAVLPAPPEDAGDVTVTVGFGERLAHELWPDRAHADMRIGPFARDTPSFIGGGDVLVQVCAQTAAAAADATTAILTAVGDLDILWARAGYRDAPTEHGTTRTSTGFIDGIINPRTTEELADGVWVNAEQDTYAVFRRMRIAEAFGALDVPEQEHAMGRRRDTGAPLSGGGPLAEVDLFEKAADGKLLTPTNSHARRAHPASIGRSLMLRRSYAFDPEEGYGLLFVAFMNDPQTFAMTQRRLDEADDFLAHTSTDAGGMFFVPGVL